MPVQCIGHGGASGLAPANTLRGFRLAAAHGADVLEFDVRAAGGRLVLAHLPVLARLPGCLELEDALRTLAGEEFAGMGFVADLKTPGTEVAVADALRRHGLLGRTLVASQCPPLLRRVREHDPEVRVAISIAGRLSRRLARWRAWRDEVVAAIRAGSFDAAMVHRRLVDAELVERLRELGAELYAWTVECDAQVRALLALELDGIVTSDPRLVRAALARRPAGPVA